MEHLSNKRKITIMVAIMVSMLFAAINQTIVGTALPRIIAILGGLDHYSWVITIYMLTSAIATILVGKLSDIYGRKIFILSGIGIFITGAFLCGTATSMMQLIAFRGLQGIGAGIIISTSFSAIGDLFAPRERGRWSGLMGGIFGVASIFGPTLGGYMVDHFAWQWVFWIFLPLGIVAFIMIFTLFPRTERKQTERVDYVGSLLLSLTIVTLLLAFTWGGTTYAWGSVQIISLLLVSLFSLALFLLVEQRVKSPVLPLWLFKNSVFTISNLVGFMLGAGMFGAIIYMPFFVQGAMGISATYSGYITMPMSISMAIASAVSGQMMTRRGRYKNLGLIGLGLMTLGMLSLAFMDTQTSVPLAVLNMIIVGWGLGMAMSVYLLAAQNAIDTNLLGVATASHQLFRNLGGTIGLSVFGMIMNSSMASQIKQLSAKTDGQVPFHDEALANHVQELTDPSLLLDQPKLAELQLTLPTELAQPFSLWMEMMRDVIATSLVHVFATCAVIMCGSLLLSCLLKEIPLRSATQKPAANQTSMPLAGTSNDC